VSDEGYRLYRGRCKEMSEEACAKDRTLKLVRGHYYCPVWNSDEPHWWCERPDGSVYDPTAQQFPSGGAGIYTPFDGFVACAQCGKEIPEEQATIGGSYALCGSRCYGVFVGVVCE
jgi:hypothetical protein